MGEETENAIGKRFSEVGNEAMVQNALEELNRVDVGELSHDELNAHADALKAVSWLRESISEPEKRRPNAQINEPYGFVDD